jgi:putative FmdB family regulatory protein
MPTYSYRCTECATAFDIQQSFTDDALTECPTCSGRLRKLFSAVGITFNGSGFYRTDSRAKQGASGATESSGSGSTSGSPSTTGTPSTGSPSTSAPASTPAKAPAATAS